MIILCIEALPQVIILIIILFLFILLCVAKSQALSPIDYVPLPVKNEEGILSEFKGESIVQFNKRTKNKAAPVIPGEEVFEYDPKKFTLYPQKKAGKVQVFFVNYEGRPGPEIALDKPVLYGAHNQIRINEKVIKLAIERMKKGFSTLEISEGEKMEYLDLANVGGGKKYNAVQVPDMNSPAGSISTIVS